jgi:amidase
MWGLLSEHCVTRSVRDSARMLSVTSNAESALPPLGALERDSLLAGSPGIGVRSLRIGLYRYTTMGREPSAEVAGALAKTAALCSSLGHELVEVAGPAVDGPVLSKAFFTLAGAVMSGLEQMMRGMLGRPLGAEDLEPFSLELIAWFRDLAPGALESALGAIQRESRSILAFVEPFDVVLCPTMPDPPPLLGTLAPTKGREELVRLTEDLAGYTAIQNMAGLPAMSVPLHQTSLGLPIGMHFAAKPGAESTLLRLAYELEDAAPWSGRWPSLVA